MCDTVGFVKNGKAVFGKNSDRSPNEPQILEFIPSVDHGEAAVKTTYIEVPQVKHTKAVLLSRPVWLWGAEIGVNECGVCIGNEAVWTKGGYPKTGLTGMDLLRLALERSETADEAADTIKELLTEWGQGGNCGYDHSFFYDNSFLIMDRKGLLVLETSGREWAVKKYERAGISNRLSISDPDSCSERPGTNFASKHADIIYNAGSGSRKRMAITNAHLENARTVGDVFSILRCHDDNVRNPFSKGTVTSPCMHYGGIVGDHTTASMAVDLKASRTIVWSTGSSLPCVSLYKPWIFGDNPSPAMEDGRKYWYEKESFLRSLIGKKIPEEYFAERDGLEKSWLEAMDAHEPNLTELCFRQEREFYGKWSEYSFEEEKTSGAFNSRWLKKTEVFAKEFAELRV